MKRTSICLLLLALASATSAQVLQAGKSWQYLLMNESHLLNDCPPCGRPSILEPMRGSFTLLGTDTTNEFTLTNINFIVRRGGETNYTLTGHGSLLFKSAAWQEIRLRLSVNNGFTNEALFFTNDIVKDVVKTWPMVDVQADENPGYFARVYRLRIAAAPMRDALFSSTKDGPVTNGAPAFLAGDILSLGGKVARASDLTARLSLTNGSTAGIDAFELRPAGEVWFSLDRDAASITLGALRNGDLLSSNGQLVKRNADLLQRFEPAQPVEAGLDAVWRHPNGEIWFSVEQSVTSSRVGSLLPGGILSDAGTVIRTGKQLLAPFQPNPQNDDYGLDALYVWPWGEIWFSVSETITNSAWGVINEGDVLSDRGYVAFSERDLLGGYLAPDSAPACGLDALAIWTDLGQGGGDLSIRSIEHVRAPRSTFLRWAGSGAIFQVERSTDVAGPYVPASGPVLGLEWTDAAAPVDRAFYRLRQWRE